MWSVGTECSIKEKIFFKKKALGIEISRNDEENSGIT